MSEFSLLNIKSQYLSKSFSHGSHSTFFFEIQKNNMCGRTFFGGFSGDFRGAFLVYELKSNVDEERNISNFNKSYP